MDIRPATLIREVSPSEPWDAVIEEAKSFTWTRRCEVALLKLEPESLVLVQGGADGIEFETEDRRVFVNVDGIRRRVVLLAWHTHPRPTGPSDHDRRFLALLGQPSSVIYEMFADGRGTRFNALGQEDA
jgi:hypothetical protein